MHDGSSQADCALFATLAEKDVALVMDHIILH